MFAPWLRESTRAFGEVFASRGLRRLQLALAGSVIGDWAFAIAVSVYAYHVGGATAVGVLALVRCLLAAAAAPFLSSLADRHRRRSVMMGADAVRAVATGIAAVGVGIDAPSVVVYAMVVVVSVASTAFVPAQTALLPSLTASPEELTAANVVTSTIESVGLFIGPAIAGVLLSVIGVDWVIALNAGSFVWSFALLAGIPRGEVPERPDDAPHFLRDAIGGFAAVVHDTKLLVIVSLYGVQVFVSGAITVLIVVLALGPLNMGQSGVGSLNAAIGVGGVVGSIVAAALVSRGRLALDFAIGLMGWGVPIALIATQMSSWFALAMLLVLGIGNVLVDVSALTLLQRVAADEVLGRVFGVLETVFAATFGVGAAVTPVLIHAVGVRATLVIIGSLLPALVVVAWPVLRAVDVGVRLPERLVLARGVPFLGPLPEANIERITGLLDAVSVTAGEAVFTQGDEGDRFYLIEAGEASVVRDGTEVARLEPGGYFGEIALVQDVPRTATVRAITDLSLLALDRDEFIAAVTGHAPSREAADAVISTRLGGLRPGIAAL
ncbi:MAG TPA: MFS transporter [Mycobacterium sp.]|nr:MFS transporter [Mycobacterium sp.]